MINYYNHHIWDFLIHRSLKNLDILSNAYAFMSGVKNE